MSLGRSPVIVGPPPLPGRPPWGGRPPPRPPAVLDGERRRDPGAVHRGGPGSAIGLDDVTVEAHREAGHRAEVEGGPQGPPDEPLDLLGAARELAGPLPRVARRGGAREE